jgi:hypothetical protein
MVLGKAPLGETCDKDTDCDNKGSVCLRGSCQCHPYYVRMASEKMPNGRCVIRELNFDYFETLSNLVPSKIGQDCSTKCREPLFCRNGKCQCVQRGSTFVRNGECVSGKNRFSNPYQTVYFQSQKSEIVAHVIITVLLRFRHV